MLLSLVYFALRRLLRALAPCGDDDLARDVELLSCATSCGYSNDNGPAQRCVEVSAFCSPRRVACCPTSAGTLILGRRHLELVLQTYEGHYNAARPHRRIGLDCPDGRPPLSTPTATVVRRRDLLGGLIHEYELAA